MRPSYLIFCPMLPSIGYLKIFNNDLWRSMRNFIIGGVSSVLLYFCRSRWRDLFQCNKLSREREFIKTLLHRIISIVSSSRDLHNTWDQTSHDEETWRGVLSVRRAMVDHIVSLRWSFTLSSHRGRGILSPSEWLY